MAKRKYRTKVRLFRVNVDTPIGGRKSPVYFGTSKEQVRKFMKKKYPYSKVKSIVQLKRW